MTLKILPLLVAASVATASSAAPQPGSPDLNIADQPHYAQVLSSRPVFHPVRVPIPERECGEQEAFGFRSDAGPRMAAGQLAEHGRCRTVTRFRDEQRLEAYEVTYRFHGRVYTTRMPYDPGTRVPVRIRPRSGRQ